MKEVGGSEGGRGNEGGRVVVKLPSVREWLALQSEVLVRERCFVMQESWCFKCEVNASDSEWAVPVGACPTENNNCVHPLAAVLTFEGCLNSPSLVKHPSLVKSPSFGKHLNS